MSGFVFVFDFVKNMERSVVKSAIRGVDTARSIRVPSMYNILIYSIHPFEFAMYV